MKKVNYKFTVKIYNMEKDKSFAFISHHTRVSSLKDIIESGALQPTKVQQEIFEANNPGLEYSLYNYEETSQGIGDFEKYRKSVFYSVIFRDNDGDPIFEPPRLMEAYLIFSPKILEKYCTRSDIGSLPVFCDRWSYGKIKPESSKYYDVKLSLEENLKSWRSMLQSDIEKYHKIFKDVKDSLDSSDIVLYKEKFIQVESGTLICELLLEGEMKLKDSLNSKNQDLLYIYINEEPPEIKMKLDQMYIKMGKPHMLEVREKQRRELEQLILDHPELPWIKTNPFKI